MNKWADANWAWNPLIILMEKERGAYRKRQFKAKFELPKQLSDVWFQIMEAKLG